jgi:hypothetical protein
VASFPTLKSGAVAQYGSARTREFATQVFRFLDGSEQRMAQYGAALRQWSIKLELLDESEIENLRAFFESQAGRAGVFSFTDPWDGTVYASCSFDSDTLDVEFSGVARGAARVVVRENRN